MKILIIDDHPLIREALRHVLTMLDAQIHLIEAQNYGEACVALEQHPDIALTLLDLGLPDIDGLTALARLRDDYAATPIVVLSATETPEVVTRAIDAGAMGFIPKTSSNQLLLNALRLVLAGGVYLPAEVLHQSQSTAIKPPPAQSGPAQDARMLSPADVGLTARQADVLALLIQGKPNKLICRALNLAEGTVKIHVTGILKKLNVTNRTQAVIAVSKLGLRFPQLG